MWFYLAKLLLPIIVPAGIGLAKAIADRAADGVSSRVPKVLWPALAALLSQLATLVRPDLFLFADIPAEASTAIYSVASVGVREFVEKVMRATGMWETPTVEVSTDALTSPSGVSMVSAAAPRDQKLMLIASTIAAKYPVLDYQAILDMRNTAAAQGRMLTVEDAMTLLVEAKKGG